MIFAFSFASIGYWLIFVLLVILIILFTFLFLRDMSKPIVIKNLDLPGFLQGCRMAVDNKHNDVSTLNSHGLLGYKITVLMSSGSLLNYDDEKHNYVSVKIGDDCNIKPHVYYMYFNRNIDTGIVERLVSQACCLVTIADIKPYQMDDNTVMLEIRPA